MTTLSFEKLLQNFWILHSTYIKRTGIENKIEQMDEVWFKIFLCLHYDNAIFQTLHIHKKWKQANSWTAAGGFWLLNKVSLLKKLIENKIELEQVTLEVYYQLMVCLMHLQCTVTQAHKLGLQGALLMYCNNAAHIAACVPPCEALLNFRIGQFLHPNAFIGGRHPI